MKLITLFILVSMFTGCASSLKSERSVASDTIGNPVTKEHSFSGVVVGVLSELRNDTYNRYLIGEVEVENEKLSNTISVSVLRDDSVSNVLMLNHMESGKPLFFEVRRGVSYLYEGRKSSDRTTTELLSVSNMPIGDI